MTRLVFQVHISSTTAQNLPPATMEDASNQHSLSPVIFFLMGSLAALLIVVILVLVLRKFLKASELHKLLAKKGTSKAADFLSGNLRTISYFEFHQLKKATRNFHPGYLLGRGGFGPVYKGKLKDGRLIAVKQLALNKSQQGEAEFLAEVKMITSIQHKNLVRLLGCCSDGPQRVLVYEYMKNKSLDHILFGKTDQFLPWSTRYQIIIGIARGLQYLHEDSHLRIVHRDIKASNILLDEKFQPKIGDFGLARFFPEDQAYLSTTFAGTLGYTAPEYAIRGELTEKADIYSFGVLVLEVISRRKNTDFALPSEMQYLPEYAWKLHERSKVIDLVDPRLDETGYKEDDILQAIHVAFLCLQPHPNLRPPMSEIVAMLTCKTQRPEIPARLVFLDTRGRKPEYLSWETISEAFPSPLRSESPGLAQLQKGIV